MRVVLDTNILISAFLSNGSPRKVFGRVLEGDVVLLLSMQLLREFEGVISRKKFGFSRGGRQENDRPAPEGGIYSRARGHAKPHQGDPDDDRVLECAVAGDAEYIVTGDRHLLNLGECGDIKIMTAAKFLEHIG